MGLPIATRLTPVARTSSYYFVLLMVMAVANPYLGPWLAGQGLTPAEIGIINAVPYFLVIVMNQVVGRIADKASDWRSTIIVCSVAGIVGPVLLLFIDGFWGILVGWTLVIMPFLAMGPVVDAASIRLARRVGADFSLIRVWGSIGFVAATIVAGFFFEVWGVAAFLWLVLAAASIRALLSLQLPLFKAPATEEERKVALPPKRHSPLVATRSREIWRLWFILPVIGTALVHSSHMMQVGFGALMWERAGIPSSMFGPLWAVATAGEIFVMLVFARLARNFSARHLLLVASLIAVFRWIGFALEPPLWGLFLLQVLNLATFGLSYLAIVNFIANWTGENIAAEAVSVFQMLRQVFTVAALIGFGYLVASFGAGAYYAAAAMGAAGAVLTLASLLLMHPAREARQLAR